MSSYEVFSMFGLAGVLILIIGFYSILVTDNLIRTLIGMELLNKAVTLLIIIAGYITNKLGLAQALAITLIVIDVVVTVVAVGTVMCIFKQNRSVDIGTVGNLKG